MGTPRRGAILTPDRNNRRKETPKIGDQLGQYFCDKRRKDYKPDNRECPGEVRGVAFRVPYF